MKKHILINTSFNPSVYFYDEGSSIRKFQVDHTPLGFPERAFSSMVTALGILKLKNSRIVIDSTVGISTHHIGMLKSISSDFVVLDSINDGLKNYALAFFDMHVEAKHKRMIGEDTVYVIVSSPDREGLGGLSIYTTKMNGLQTSKDTTLIKSSPSLGAMFEAAKLYTNTKKAPQEISGIPMANIIEFEELSKVDDHISMNVGRIIGEISGSFAFGYDPPTLAENISLWHSRFRASFETHQASYARLVVGYFTRVIFEKVLQALITSYKMKHVIFVGDIFTDNLRNQALLHLVKGVVSIVASAEATAGAIPAAGYIIGGYEELRGTELSPSEAEQVLNNDILNRIVGSTGYGYVAVPIIDMPVYKQPDDTEQLPGESTAVITPIICKKSPL